MFIESKILEQMLRQQGTSIRSFETRSLYRQTFWKVKNIKPSKLLSQIWNSAQIKQRSDKNFY